jgi:hypothetical protein
MTSVSYPELVRRADVTVINKPLADECAFSQDATGRRSPRRVDLLLPRHPRVRARHLTTQVYARPGDTYRFHACPTWHHLLTSMTTG